MIFFLLLIFARSGDSSPTIQCHWWKYKEASAGPTQTFVRPDTRATGYVTVLPEFSEKSSGLSCEEGLTPAQTNSFSPQQPVVLSYTVSKKSSRQELFRLS